MGNNFIKCPSCKELSTISEWDKETMEIVRGLTGDSHLEITSIAQRHEGSLFRCPNKECEDEVVTDGEGVLRVQDETGDPVT